ncbi:MFS general substrate transporter [Amanita rubescens]|nr:MFS general substrate transporter [Amanita rubescens]
MMQLARTVAKFLHGPKDEVTYFLLGLSLLTVHLVGPPYMDPKLHSDEKLQERYEDGGQEELSDAETAIEEQQLLNKLDRRILPITCLLYLFAYLDRSNLGNARLMGLPSILGKNKDPTGVLFDWVNSAFFFSYILCQTPATVVSKLYPPRVWMACCAAGWGLTSTLMSTGFDFGGLMTARIFLGIFEAGFGPAIPLYFCEYPMAYWFGFAAVAGAFGAHIENWRLLFIVEGIPTIILSIFTYFFLPDRPEATTYLTARERKLAVARMNRATSGDVGAVVQKRHVWMALRDWRVWTAGVIYFGLNCALSSISAFLPTIIASFGYSDARAQLFTVPPYVVTAVVLITFSFISDKLQTRGVPISIACTISAVGYLLLLVVHQNKHVRYFAIFCITSGTYTSIGLTIAWFAHNLGSETKKAAGIPTFMAIVSCALSWLAVICALILTTSYRRDNARRDRKYGVPEPDARVDTSELADKAPEFRYVP